MDPAEKQLRERLRQIAGAIEVISDSEFTLEGERCGALDDVPTDKTGRGVELEPLIFSLRKQIYHRFYACVPSGGSSANVIKSPDDPLIRQLSEANQSSGGWDDGWTVTHRSANGFVTARKDQRSNVFPPGQFLYEEGPRHPEKGDIIRIRVYRESRVMQDGFYFVFGETIPDQEDARSVLRVYWNIDESGAVELVRRATESFNRYSIPFRLKCPKRASAYARVDTAVLYIGLRHAPIASELVGDIYAELKPFLCEATPLFAKRLGHGLALAQSPADGQSFGMHRCQIVAEGLKAAWESGGSTEGDRLAAIERQFDLRGVSLKAPHLNPGQTEQQGHTDWLQFS